MSVQIIKSKPTSPGRRGKVYIKDSSLFSGRPYSSLTTSLSKTGGRNNLGRITTRHRGGGHKRLYRIIDFKRDKFDIYGLVERIEYDPNRSANIALIKYEDGERRYILCPNNLKQGDKVQSGQNVGVKVGNNMPMLNIPLGMSIHNIELKLNKGKPRIPFREKWTFTHLLI